jgi:hypothetical protein
MTLSADGTTAAHATMDLAWDPASRVAFMRCRPGAVFTGEAGEFLVGALAKWVGPAPAPFALLVDAAEVEKTTADYRAVLARFFRPRREVAAIAMYHMSPALRIATEMFSIGTGVPLRGFAAEAPAREWLRKRGIAA